MVVFWFGKDLGVGMATEGIEVRSVGNSSTLQKSKLVAAFNLRASIEYQTRNCTFNAFLKT